MDNQSIYIMSQSRISLEKLIACGLLLGETRNVQRQTTEGPHCTLHVYKPHYEMCSVIRSAEHKHADKSWTRNEWSLLGCYAVWLL
jgi:hypothetical protein